MAGLKIPDSSAFKSMWSGPLTLTEIGQIYGAKPSTVSQTARKYGLPRREGGPVSGKRRMIDRLVPEREVNRKPMPQDVPGSPFWTAKRDITVWETQGSWADISKLAHEWGCMTAFVTARWHKLKAAG